MRLTILVVTILFNGVINGQTNNNLTDSVKYYRIEEAQYIKNDSIYNIDKEFIEQQSGILFVEMKDSSVLISLDNGGIENVLLLGYAKKIKNPGFKLNRDDAEFFLWSFKGHNDKDLLDAFVYREYITNSLEEKGKLYFLISIIFADYSTYQFFTYPIPNQ